ncbi:MAG: ATP-binding protein [Candidatus Bathyarchaeota archaeon]|nr:ATP-binding protein [Candidatus Bathyarchaeota archaeon]
MNGLHELEKYALNYANEAVKLDRQGLKNQAAEKYQKAIEVLLKICNLYPNTPQSRIYLKYIESYKRRIEDIKGNHEDGLETSNIDKEKIILQTEKPGVRWSDIANLEEAKKAIQEAIIYPVKRPDLFPLGWPRGILLFGPPGCGKTLLAAAVASEIDANFYSVDAASVMSKWLGESEKNVAILFTEARKSAENGKPSIIFIDEVDSLTRTFSTEVGGETRVRNQFLKEMDGINDKNRKHFVYVIAATNKPWFLDEPFIRRFQKRILIPPPDYHARLEMFKIYSKDLNLSPNVDLMELARKTEGYNGSDIRDIFQTVQLKVVREFFSSQKADDPNLKPRPIQMEDFLEIIEKRKPSISQEMLKQYINWFEKFKAL